jgi:hypothetical protein
MTTCQTRGAAFLREGDDDLESWTPSQSIRVVRSGQVAAAAGVELDFIPGVLTVVVSIYQLICWCVLKLS